MATSPRRELLDLAAEYGDRAVACAIAAVMADHLRHRMREARVAALVEQAIREAEERSFILTDRTGGV